MQNERFQSQRAFPDITGQERFLEAYRYANFISGENIILPKDIQHMLLMLINNLLLKKVLMN